LSQQHHNLRPAPSHFSSANNVWSDVALGRRTAGAAATQPSPRPCVRNCHSRTRQWSAAPYRRRFPPSAPTKLDSGTSYLRRRAGAPTLASASSSSEALLKLHRRRLRPRCDPLCSSVTALPARHHGVYSQMSFRTSNRARQRRQPLPQAHGRLLHCHRPCGPLSLIASPPASLLVMMLSRSPP
jgi:hypothetical protein